MMLFCFVIHKLKKDILVNKMFTIIFIRAGFQAGCGMLTLGVALWFWAVIGLGCTLKPKKTNPIDKHGDSIYGNFTWLYDKKL